MLFEIGMDRNDDKVTDWWYRYMVLQRTGWYQMHGTIIIPFNCLAKETSNAIIKICRFRTRDSIYYGIYTHQSPSLNCSLPLRILYFGLKTQTAQRECGLTWLAASSVPFTIKTRHFGLESQSTKSSLSQYTVSCCLFVMMDERE